RRGRLRAASLLIDVPRLRLLAEATTLPTGLSRIGLGFEKGRIVVSGSVAAAGRDAGFKARLRLGPGTGRLLRITVEGHRVPGAPPLPLAAIGAAVLTGLADQLPDEKSVHRTDDALELDVLQAALDELLVAEGWRLPSTASVRLSSAVVSVRGLELPWGEEGGVQAVAAGVSERTSQGYEAPVAALRRAVEDAPRGPERAIVAQKLAVACERLSDEEGAVAALHVCIENAGPGTLVATA